MDEERIWRVIAASIVSSDETPSSCKRGFYALFLLGGWIHCSGGLMWTRCIVSTFDTHFFLPWCFSYIIIELKNCWHLARCLPLVYIWRLKWRFCQLRAGYGSRNLDRPQNGFLTDTVCIIQIYLCGWSCTTDPVSCTFPTVQCSELPNLYSLIGRPPYFGIDTAQTLTW